MILVYKLGEHLYVLHHHPLAEIWCMSVGIIICSVIEADIAGYGVILMDNAGYRVVPHGDIMGRYYDEV